MIGPKNKWKLMEDPLEKFYVYTGNDNVKIFKEIY